MKTKWGDLEIDWSAVNWRRMTMREAIIQYWPEAAGAKPPSRIRFARICEGSSRAVQFVPFAHGIRSERASGKTIAGLFEAVAEEHLTQPNNYLRVPYRGFAALQAKSRPARVDRALGDFHRSDGDFQWLQRIERS